MVLKLGVDVLDVSLVVDYNDGFVTEVQIWVLGA